MHAISSWTALHMRFMINNHAIWSEYVYRLFYKSFCRICGKLLYGLQNWLFFWFSRKLLNWFNIYVLIQNQKNLRVLQVEQVLQVEPAQPVEQVEQVEHTVFIVLFGTTLHILQRNASSEHL